MAGFTYDEDGFLVTPHNNTKGSNTDTALDRIEISINEILKLLQNSLEKDHGYKVKSQYQNDLELASSQVKEFGKNLKNSAGAISAFEEKVKEFDIGSDNLFSPPSQKNKTGNNQQSNPRAGARPNTNLNGAQGAEVSQDIVTPRQSGKHANRDEKGRFIGGGQTGSNDEKGFFKKLTAILPKNMGLDTQGVDPTLDALRELKTVFTPVKKVSSVFLKPLTGVMRNRKKNEPIPKEQERHNSRELSLLNEIARHTKNTLSPMGLARMLPMAGIAIGTAVVSMIAPKASGFFGGGKESNENGNTGTKGGLVGWLANKRKLQKQETPLPKKEDGQRVYGDSSGSAQTVLAGTTTEQEKTKAILKKMEGFSNKAYWDKNAYRAGYGSDTYTDKDNQVHKVTVNSHVSKEDAERDLSRRAGIFAQSARKTVGAEAWDKLPDDTKSALTSVTYNYGSLTKLKDLTSAVRGGDTNKIADEVVKLKRHNNGELTSRRNFEASIIRGSDTKKPSTSVFAKPSTKSQQLAQQAEQLSKNDPIAKGVQQSSVNPAINQGRMQSLQNLKLPKLTPVEQPLTPLTAKQAPIVQGSSHDTISQNISDRGLAHTTTGGIGQRNRYSV